MYQVIMRENSNFSIRNEALQRRMLQGAEFRLVSCCFICQAGKIPSETQTTLTLFALPSLLFSPQSLSVSCLPNATGGTCVHTARSIWVWTHLSTRPTQLLKCSLHAPHSFFCAMTSAEWRGSEESWTHCTWEDKQDFFVKLKWIYIYIYT